jgi:hypothetical protein
MPHQPDYPGPFSIFNEENESALLHRFFAHINVCVRSLFG